MLGLLQRFVLQLLEVLKSLRRDLGFLLIIGFLSCIMFGLLLLQTVAVVQHLLDLTFMGIWLWLLLALLSGEWLAWCAELTWLLASA